MNPVRYWARIVVTANPKISPRTLEELINCLVANGIILLIASSFYLMLNIVIEATPFLRVVSAATTLALMLFMMISLFMRIHRVREWRDRMEEPAE